MCEIDEAGGLGCTAEVGGDGSGDNVLGVFMVEDDRSSEVSLYLGRGGEDGFVEVGLRVQGF